MANSFGQSSDSVTQLFFGFSETVFFGTHKFTLLTRDKTRAVYLRQHAQTKKLRGMILTNGRDVWECDCLTLLQVLSCEIDAGQG